MTVYRLEMERANGADHLFPRVFDTVEDACAWAERTVDQLADHPGWRCRGWRIKTVDRGTVVTNVPWHDPEYDPDPFGPLAPFAQGGTTETVASDPPAPAPPFRP